MKNWQVEKLTGWKIDSLKIWQFKKSTVWKFDRQFFSFPGWWFANFTVYYWYSVDNWNKEKLTVCHFTFDSLEFGNLTFWSLAFLQFYFLIVLQYDSVLDSQYKSFIGLQFDSLPDNRVAVFESTVLQCFEANDH